MVGRTALAAVAASALVFAGGGLAYADNDFPDADSSLIEVYVQSESDIEKLVADGFDLAEYKRVEDDQIVVAVDATPIEVGALKKRGFGLGRTIESPEHRAVIAAERDAQRELDSRALEYAENGVPKTRAAVTVPGETVIQRANKFTNYAGTFLYVEAHNKAITRVGNTAQFTGPTLQMAYAGADGVFTPAAAAMPRFIDTDPTPDEYLYNRQLIRLTGAAANIPAAQMTVRVAASTGSVDTFKVTEWVGQTLPPHVAGYQQGFFNRYQDPTENRAQLDKLAADFPNLVTAVNLPNLTNGYQRKSRPSWPAPAASARLAGPVRRADRRVHRRDHRGRSGGVDPVQRHRRPADLRDRGRHPGWLDRLHLHAQEPGGPGHRRPDRHRHEPGVHHQSEPAHDRHVHVRDLRLPRRRRRLHVQGPARHRLGRRGIGGRGRPSRPRTGATRAAIRSPPRSATRGPTTPRCPSP